MIVLKRKKCIRCKILRNPSSFANNSNWTKHTICKTCHNKYASEHYRKNKSKYKENLRRRQKIAHDFINDIKSKNPCKDCGKKYPFYIMEFDHRNPNTKRDAVSKLRRHCSHKTISKEIAKCDLLCSNCHQARTYLRTHKTINKRASD